MHYYGAIYQLILGRRNLAFWPIVRSCSINIRNEDWIPVYRFKPMPFVQTFSKFKIATAFSCSSITPILYYLAAHNQVAYSFANFFLGATFVTLGTLAVYSYYAMRIVGVISISSTNPEKYRFGTITFWGTRRNMIVNLIDVIPPSDLGYDMKKDMIVGVEISKNDNKFLLPMILNNVISLDEFSVVHNNPPEPTDDLKAFEKRLREISSGLTRKQYYWRIFVTVLLLFWMTFVYFWFVDPLTSYDPLSISLFNHPLLVISSFMILISAIYGAFKKMFLTQVIMDRLATVLDNFNMGCEKCGRLRLRHKPNPNHSYHFSRNN